MTHKLKCWPVYYSSLISGDKNFELRENDREYKVGDILEMCEYDINLGYTGRVSFYLVTYILNGGVMGLHKGSCIMAIKSITV